jgi:hypothetical protein
MSKAAAKHVVRSNAQRANEPVAAPSPIATVSDREAVPATQSPPHDDLSDRAGTACDDAASMSRLSIQFDGRKYRYREYQYEKLGDAIAYAHLMRLRNMSDDSRAAVPRVSVVQPPGESQRQLMQQLSISFDDGTYKLGPFRYDNLADAVSYARTCLRRYIAERSK